MELQGAVIVGEQEEAAKWKHPQTLLSIHVNDATDEVLFYAHIVMMDMSNATCVMERERS
jgi:hypothetical protein